MKRSANEILTLCFPTKWGAFKYLRPSYQTNIEAKSATDSLIESGAISIGHPMDYGWPMSEYFPKLISEKVFTCSSGVGRKTEARRWACIKKIQTNDGIKI